MGHKPSDKHKGFSESTSCLLLSFRLVCWFDPQIGGISRYPTNQTPPPTMVSHHSPVRTASHQSTSSSSSFASLHPHNAHELHHHHHQQQQQHKTVNIARILLHLIGIGCFLHVVFVKPPQGTISIANMVVADGAGDVSQPGGRSSSTSSTIRQDEETQSSLPSSSCHYHPMQLTQRRRVQSSNKRRKHPFTKKSFKKFFLLKFPTTKSRTGMRSRVPTWHRRVIYRIRLGAIPF